MSYAAFKMLHWPTGIENCASGFITHAAAELAVHVPSLQPEDLESDWPVARRIGPVPNLVVSAGNVLEIYLVRVQEDDGRQARASAEPARGGIMEGISGARLELVCHYRLHGNVESMAIISPGGDDRRRRDAIALAFKDSKVSVVEYEDSIHGLRTSSMHCFEGPEWNHLKRGRESFCRGPLVKSDPQGRCAGVLVYGLQMIILKASQIGHGIVGDDEANRSQGTLSISIESSYTINLEELDTKHVKDFTFVHGYIEPVMVVLHETELTWAGRVSWKRHTCMVSAFSINTSLKQHPLIWSASNLPHDAYKLLAVPSPIGGVLVICANSIHYHSQSASCVLGLNSFFVPADGSSDIQRSGFNVELDAANTAWLSHDVVMFSTKSGELLLLTLYFDGRVVYRFDLSKSKASVLTSCIATIGNKFFFLASRLGDSLLVQYSSGMRTVNSSHEKDETIDIDVDGPHAKRLRRSSIDGLQDCVTMEELSLHSSIPNTSDSAQRNFSFSVRDSLTNVGPLKDFSYGLRINADPDASGISKQSNYELVCCAGHGKNGVICILQQSIRPDLITEVELPGCRGIWTVYHKSSRGQLSDSSRAVNEDDEYHAYLIISLESRTMVLETGELLGEVTESVDYYVQGSTIAAGNLFGRRRVVQVYARGARILDGSYMTQELPLGPSEASSNSENPTVVSVSIADPYVLLKMSDGTIQLLIGDASSSTVSVCIPAVVTSSAGPISACTLYHDKGPDPWLHKASTDAWLSTGIADIDGTDGSMHDHGDIYCVLCYENGILEIFDVPSFKCVYTVKGFISGKRYLLDTYINEPVKDDRLLTKSSEETNAPVKNESIRSMRVVELAMLRWSGHHSHPFLFGLLNDGTLLCYHAYLYEAQENSVKIEDSIPTQGSVDQDAIPTSRLRNLRFLRVSLNMFAREDSIDATPRPRMTVFKNVGGYQGLFLSGSRPTWLMVCRERLRCHPQLCDGSVAAFTVLHNVNCNHGLIYVTTQGFLKICQLPSSMNYDNYWPVQKIPLRGTPHQVTYYSEKNLYPIIISVPVERPLNQVISSFTEQDLSHQYEMDGPSSDTMQKYTIEEFEVQVMEREKSTGRWETKKAITMHASEHALTVRMVTLMNSTTLENEILLAIGTAYVQGEDVAARGRILLFSAQDSVLEVYSKELKGAISALASLQGYLLVASGPKITLYKWTGSELNGVAFYDAPPLHAVSMNTVKNFILLGDIHKSIYFLNWKEQGAQLSLLAKDFGALDCYATEFLIDGSTLSLVVSDDQKNIQIFYYAPKMSESWKGQKLLSRAEFHAGAHITKFLRLQMLPTAPDRTTSAAGAEKINRFALLFATLDGSIGCIAPLDELTFRRLQSLHKRLVDAVPHVCGLNPKAFRQFRSNGKAHRPGPDHMVDYELLHHYEMLSLEEQLEIANQIGTTRTQILSNLSDLSLGTSFL